MAKLRISFETTKEMENFMFPVTSDEVEKSRFVKKLSNPLVIHFKMVTFANEKKAIRIKED